MGIASVVPHSPGVCPLEAETAMGHSLIAKLVTEFIGTGFLCLTVTTCAGSKMPVAALAIGSILGCMIYMGGHISGGHYNPAVTLANVIRGSTPPIDGALYLLVQVTAGAVFGGMAFAWKDDMVGNNLGYPARGANISSSAALVCEILITFMLANTVLHCATIEESKDRSYYGLAIGFTVTSGAISVGGISGGCFNPAVSMLCLINGHYDDLWIYWVGPLVGATLAGCLFHLLRSLPGGRTSKGCRVPLGNSAIRFSYHSVWDVLPALVVEFFGTFMLCFTVATAAAPSNSQLGDNSDPLASLSIGACLMVWVYSGGYISGGVYNPAVSLGLMFRFMWSAKKNDPYAEKFKEVYLAALYICMQVAGSFAAGGVAHHVLEDLEKSTGETAGTAIGYPYPSADDGPAFLAELLGTFALVLTVLNVATTKEVENNCNFGFAIGFTVVAMAAAFGGISGGAFNPAVGLLAIPAEAHEMSSIWIYWVAGPLASILAAAVYYLQNEDEFCCHEEFEPIATKAPGNQYGANDEAVGMSLTDAANNEQKADILY